MLPRVLRFSRSLSLLGVFAAARTLSAADAPAPESHPPIPVHFTLKSPGFVTLVIENADGTRVRNLISETEFPAGDNIAYWDALDDLGRDTEAASHAVYHIPGKLTPAGTYRVRGLVRPKIDLRYELTAYHPGTPPWLTKDRSSGWLANHTPPSAILFVPEGAAPDRADHPAPGGQILVGSFVSEGGSGLAWLNLQGRKVHGQEWIGGVWTGATQLCRDEGDKPLPGVYAYTGSAWRGDKYNGNHPELRLHMLVNGAGKLKAPGDHRMGTGEDPPVLHPTFKLPDDLPDPERSGIPVLGGLAARNGILIAAVTPLNELIFIDVAQHKTLATAPLDKPHGMAFTRDGQLLAISGRKIVRVAMPKLDTTVATTQPATLADPQTVVADGLEDPQQIALDKDGNLYVSDRGDSHQVKVFSPAGKLLRAIGAAGKPGVGPYDPTHMHAPNGVTIDSAGKLWVAETDAIPKRISVWTLDGKFTAAFYGPPHYGGGGTIDPIDGSRFFFADSGGGMELKLDWDHPTVKNHPVSIYLRPELDSLRDWFRNDRSAGPETPLHANGKTYLSDCYNANPTGGISTAALWLLRDGVAHPVAVIGQANDWPAFNPAAKVKGTEGLLANAGKLASKLPPGINIQRDRVMFVWSDLNDDGNVQPDEVTCMKGDALSVNFRADLSAITGSGFLLTPSKLTAGGAPIYDLSHAGTFATDTQRPVSSGGGQAVMGHDGSFVLTNAPKPFSPFGLGGGKDGKATWSYPSLWPGLHASHISPLPEEPGEVIGTTRLLGLPVTPRGSDVGEIFAINGNKGNVYLFTTDGLFVATLFKDSRSASWNPSSYEPGTLVNDQSIQEEDFFPSISQAGDGKIYLSVVNCCLIRVEGLEQATRLPATELTVSTDQLAAAQKYFLDREAARQLAQKDAGPKTLTVALRAAAPQHDEKLTAWKDAQWATIDERQTQMGDWGRRKIATTAAVQIANGRLYALFKTDDPKLLNNSGESLQNLFKTGGCLDLMLGVDSHADPKRTKPVAGDERLLITRVKGKTVAVLYRQVSPHSPGPAAEFTSPIKTVKFDRVEDVSDKIELTSSEEKDAKTGKPIGAVYEVSAPLDVLGLTPTAGTSIRADVGLLRGNGFQTLQRVYWSNKATGLVSDLPSEAELTPRLWGTWKFE